MLLDWGKKDFLNLYTSFKTQGVAKQLPSLVFALTESLIEKGELTFAREYLTAVEGNEVNRLLAWINRLEGEANTADRLLAKYREGERQTNKEGFYCQVVDADLHLGDIPEALPEIFEILSSAYENTHKLIDSLEMEYGLDPMTCVEAKCQDCCKVTYPYITYVEFLYMKEHFNTQDEETKAKIYSYSKDIYKRYKDKYGKEPPFLDKDSADRHNSQYPLDFYFDCPFLGDNKCNIYSNRPYTCRVYGYGSPTGAMFKGCNYFYEQIRLSSSTTKVRKVVNMASFFDLIGKIDKKLVGKRLAAPIPIWFALSDEELEKVLRRQ